jgi:hypothetical protein
MKRPRFYFREPDGSIRYNTLDTALTDDYQNWE